MVSEKSKKNITFKFCMVCPSNTPLVIAFGEPTVLECSVCSARYQTTIPKPKKSDKRCVKCGKEGSGFLTYDVKPICYDCSSISTLLKKLKNIPKATTKKDGGRKINLCILCNSPNTFPISYTSDHRRTTNVNYLCILCAGAPYTRFLANGKQTQNTSEMPRVFNKWEPQDLIKTAIFTRTNESSPIIVQIPRKKSEKSKEKRINRNRKKKTASREDMSLVTRTRVVTQQYTLNEVHLSNK